MNSSNKNLSRTVSKIIIFVFLTIAIAYIVMNGPEFVSLFVLALVFLLIPIYLAIFFHELGHLVLGKIVGFDFLSFRFLNFAVKKEKDGKLKFYSFSLKGTAGQCIMVPAKDKTYDLSSLFWYNVGGVLFNAIIAVKMIIFVFVFDVFYIQMASSLMALINIVFIITNWFSTKVQSSDGSNYRILKNNEKSQAAFLELLRTHGDLNHGARLSTYNLEPLKALELEGEDSIQINALQLVYTQDIFLHKFEEAKTLLEKLYVKTREQTGIVSSLVESDVYLLKVIMKEDDSEEYKTKSVLQIMKAMRNNEGIALLIVLEDYRKNGVLNTRLYDAFVEASENSITKGNGLDCIDLLSYCLSLDDNAKD